MDPVSEVVSATAVASLLTNLFKLAAPSAPAWALVVVALVVGVGASVLVSVYGGEALTAQAVAGMVLQGILAAGGAAGLDRTATAAQAKREQAGG